MLVHRIPYRDSIVETNAWIQHLLEHGFAFIRDVNPEEEEVYIREEGYFESGLEEWEDANN